MPRLTDIRDALYDSLNTALGSSYQVSKYVLSAPVAKTIWLYPTTVEYHAAMGNGAQWWTFKVQAFVAITSDRGAQEIVDAFFDDDPVKAAIEGDPTLSGACQDLIVTNAAYMTWEHVALGQQQMLGGEWTVRVLC